MTPVDGILPDALLLAPMLLFTVRLFRFRPVRHHWQDVARKGSFAASLRNKDNFQMASSSEQSRPKETIEEEIPIESSGVDRLDGKLAPSIGEDDQGERTTTSPTDGLQEKEISLDEFESERIRPWEDRAAIRGGGSADESPGFPEAEAIQEKEISLDHFCPASLDALKYGASPRRNHSRLRWRGPSETEPPPPAIRHRRILAVGGAKGGVGKSMLAANMAVGLALLNRKVVLADLDLGSADLPLYIGVRSLSRTWNDFLDHKAASIEAILTPTAFEGLSLIGGNSSRLGSANLPYLQKRKIMRHLKALETDYLIIDLGDDTAYNELDFFLLADQKIIVSSTEPASVSDNYAFLKVAHNRLIERFCAKHEPLRNLGRQIRDGSLESTPNYSLDLTFQEVQALDRRAFTELKQQLDRFRLSIVLNMTESREEMVIAEEMQTFARDMLHLDIEILGAVPYDRNLKKAVRKLTPVLTENPTCPASQNICRMLAALISPDDQETTGAEIVRCAHRIRRN
jgi:flagellar biosynthesis protein FlhG